MRPQFLTLPSLLTLFQSSCQSCYECCQHPHSSGCCNPLLQSQLLFLFFVNLHLPKSTNPQLLWFCLWQSTLCILCLSLFHISFVFVLYHFIIQWNIYNFNGNFNELHLLISQFSTFEYISRNRCCALALATSAVIQYLLSSFHLFLVLLALLLILISSDFNCWHTLWGDILIKTQDCLLKPFVLSLTLYASDYAAYSNCDYAAYWPHVLNSWALNERMPRSLLFELHCSTHLQLCTLL